ncbi:MAG: glycoside hydrolase family 2 TIM barrel-domain containing protein [Bacteroidales bacterium]
MKKSIIPPIVCIFFFLNILASGALAQNDAGTPDWQNPAVYARNQEPHHIPFVPYTNVSDALKDNWNASPFYQSLNGTWNFKWFTNPAEVPENIHTEQAGAWFRNTIQVPSCWQMEGFGHPKFRNVHQPFPAEPPKVPEDYNPVGVYRKTFSIPDQWNEHQIFLHFEGVKSASYVWINGQKAGYDQGGMEQAEYDITPYLQEGTNEITVQVFRYCDGTYLECQDMWRLSGIYRDVYLMASPKTHIRDFYITTELDSRYQDAILNIQATLKNYRQQTSSNNCRVDIQLYDEADKPMLDEPLTKEDITLSAEGEQTLQFSKDIDNPKKWSAEFPNLYTVVLELKDDNGNTLEVVSDRVGFREVEIKDQAIYVNGKQIKFNGVNSHMHHPELGRAMNRETIRKDLTLMKKFNINCVRTSHYPPNHEYLDVADELGIYVVDETNDEAHATTSLSEYPEWKPMYLDRVRGMVKRDRNHPGVIIWSAGNESGSGENIASLIEEGKRLDPTRPWLYGGNAGRLAFEDIIGPRYPHPDKLRDLGEESPEEEPRPSFMDEYLAASGNSLGHLQEYWDVIRSYDRTTGGAIWDWVSPGIKRPVRLIHDTSPNNNQGILMGNAGLAPGKYGKALSLSGHDEWVEFYRDPVLDVTGDQLTLETWIYPREWNGYGYLLNKGDHQYGLKQPAPDTLQFYIHNGKTIKCETPVPNDWRNNWHHIAGIYDGEKLQLYIDGEVVNHTPHTGNIDHTPQPVNIGRNAEIYGMEHPGQLNNSLFDNVGIFDHALSPKELNNHPDTRNYKALLWCKFDSVDRQGSFFSLGIGARAYGLVWPDRQVQPEMWELKKVPQPVKIEAINLKEGKFRITNTHHFKNLRELSMHWDVRTAGSLVKAGTNRIDIEPGKEKTVSLSISDMQIPTDRDHWLRIGFRLPEKTAWAERGHEVAWEQFQLPSNVYCDSLKTRQDKPEPFEVQEDRNRVIVNGSDFQYTFHKERGMLTSLHYKGTELIKSPPRFNVWRAPIWNQTDRWGGNPMAPNWRRYGLNRLQTEVKEVNVTQENQALTIQVQTIEAAANASTKFEVGYTYEINGTGEVTLHHSVAPASDMPEWLPKIGTQMVFPDDFERFAWYGRGPFETYPDRKSGAKMGWYEKQVDDLYEPYLVPQEHGNRTDVRWAALTNEEGIGMYISGDALLNFSARNFSLDNLTRAQYTFQLKDHDGTIVNMDHKVSGVGGTPVKTLEKYRVMPKTYQYTIYLCPFDQSEEDPESIYRIQKMGK